MRVSGARLSELIYWLFLCETTVWENTTLRCDSINTSNARDDCRFTSRDLRIFYGNATRFLSQSHEIPWSPILLCARILNECPPTSLTLSKPRATPGRTESIVDDALAATFTCKSPLSGNVLKYLIAPIAIKEACLRLGTETLTFVPATRIPRDHNLHLNYKLVLKIWLIMDTIKKYSADPWTTKVRRIDNLSSRTFNFYAIHRFSLALHISTIKVFN